MLQFFLGSSDDIVEITYVVSFDLTFHREWEGTLSVSSGWDKTMVLYLVKDFSR